MSSTIKLVGEGKLQEIVIAGKGSTGMTRGTVTILLFGIGSSRVDVRTEVRVTDLVRVRVMDYVNRLVELVPF